MDNLADDREDVPTCSDEQVKERRADCEIRHRAYGLEQEIFDYVWQFTVELATRCYFRIALDTNF